MLSLRQRRFGHFKIGKMLFLTLRILIGFMAFAGNQNDILRRGLGHGPV